MGANKNREGESMKPYYETALGKLFHCDCLEIMPQLEPVDLVIADPLYNIGVADWDRIPGYHKWIVSIFQATEKASKDNATLWFFHMVFSELAKIHTMLEEKTSYRHKQMIIIDKGLGSIAGRCSIGAMRSYPKATEYLQFYTFEDRTGAKQLSEKYQKINPMAKYLRAEFNHAGVSNNSIAALFPSRTGRMTGCVRNWLLGLNFPTEEQYNTIRAHLNYEYLRKEYEDLRKEYEDLRYTFNLPMGHTDVWNDINFYNAKVDSHETPKPVTLIMRIVETASILGDTVLDPFIGSGTTAIACERLNRRWIGIEISEEYCEIAARRIERETRQLKLF